MKVYFDSDESRKVGPRYEAVERKGIGHPDTLADMVAEEFTNAYSRYTKENFGEILNHSSDKVLLSGGIAELAFGKKKVKKPMTAYLFGKTINSFGEKKIPVEEIFQEACRKIFFGVFGEEEVLGALEYRIDTNDGIGMEHSQAFYAPKEKQDLVVPESYVSNDTIICSGYAPFSFLESLVIEIENYVNDKGWKRKFPFSGFDIKVMGVKLEKEIDITLCIPFIAEKTPSLDFYRENKEKMREDIQDFVERRGAHERGFAFRVTVNTRDFGDHAYVVAFGSALDKGDFGVVGRGNKYSGVITLQRKTNVEAPAGKNPQLHSGKLFTIFAHHIAWKMYKKYGCPISIDIAAKAGESIDDPFALIVNREDGERFSEEHMRDIEKEIREDMKKITNYKEKIIMQSAIDQHRNKTFLYD